jgi:beta-glucosidase
MTWNKQLLREIGAALGLEARIYDKTLLFFPTIDMERDPRWGRNEEAYGEDPHLAGKLGVEIIKGAQGTDDFHLQIACAVKHFYANNYELERSSCDSVIPEDLKNDYYLRVFAYAFEEGRAASLMSAYNKINGIPGMLHPELNEIVRGRWGADGFFVTDGGAFTLVEKAHKYHGSYAASAAAGIKAGTDCFLDDPTLTMDSVREALDKQMLTESELDVAIFNKLRTLFRLGIYGGDANPFANPDKALLCCDAHKNLARRAAREALVLLENDGILPLSPDKTKKIAVIGQLGGETLPDWYSGHPMHKTTPLDGIKTAFPQAQVTFHDGCDTIAFQAGGAWLRVCEDGSTALDGDENTRATFRASDWGFGGHGFRCVQNGKYLTTSYDGALRCDAQNFWGWFVRELFFVEGGKIKPEKAHTGQAPVGRAMNVNAGIYDKPYADGAVEKVNEILSQLTVITIQDGISAASKAAKNADAAIVCLGNHGLVGARECVDRDDLHLPARWQALFQACQAANEQTILSLIAGYPFILPPARAILHTSHGEQELGTAIGEALSGALNPAGRLSQTWYDASKALPHINDYDIAKNKMTYLYHDGTVQYPFGHGLSYTQFAYENMHIEKQPDSIFVSFTLTNTGEHDGDEVPQLYFTGSAENCPRLQLCAFERIHLPRGASKKIAFHIPLKELHRYDTTTKAFKLHPGTYRFFAGASSRALHLQASLTL